MVKENGKDFLDHLYVFSYSHYKESETANERMFSFLDLEIGDGYKDVLFKKGKHHTNIIIYNSILNKVIGIGVGRKNRIFVSTYNCKLPLSSAIKIRVNDKSVC
jgi:hypothetical protein